MKLSFLKATLVALTTFALSGCGTFLVSPSPSSCHPEWDSEKDNNISPTESCNCDPAPGTVSLLTGVHLFRERRANADNFVARLETECTTFPISLDPGDDYSAVVGEPATNCLVFSGNHRPESVWSRVPIGRVPVGIFIKKNNVDGYVKDIRILHSTARISNNALVLDEDDILMTFPGVEGNGLDGGNRWETIRCEQSGTKFLTGISLKYSTTKGKIRQIELNYVDITLRKIEGSQPQAVVTPLPPQVVNLAQLD